MSKRTTNEVLIQSFKDFTEHLNVHQLGLIKDVARSLYRSKCEEITLTRARVMREKTTADAIRRGVKFPEPVER